MCRFTHSGSAKEHAFPSCSEVSPLFRLTKGPINRNRRHFCDFKYKVKRIRRLELLKTNYINLLSLIRFLPKVQGLDIIYI